MTASYQVSVSMSDELVTALDREAFRLDLSRAAVIRSILGDHLRDVGQLRFSDPLVASVGDTNRFYRSRQGGRA